MSEQHPPVPDIDTFNNLYWIPPLSNELRSELNANYLQYPNAQGQENFPAGSSCNFNAGGELQLKKTTANVSGTNELSILDMENGKSTSLQYVGNLNSVSTPLYSTPVNTYPLLNKYPDVAVPFDTGGNVWNSNSNGEYIPLYDFHSALGMVMGASPSTYNNALTEPQITENHICYNGYLLGVTVSNTGRTFGWVLAGNSGTVSLELVYTNSDATNASFSPPIILADAGPGESLNWKSTHYCFSKDELVYCNLKPFSGIKLSIKLNIPDASSTITVFTVNFNKHVVCNKIQSSIIPIDQP